MIYFKTRKNPRLPGAAENANGAIGNRIKPAVKSMNNLKKNISKRLYPQKIARSIRQAFDRMLEENPEESELMEWKEADFPRVDVSETDKEIKIIADAPGMEPENLRVNVKEDYIEISGSIEREEEEKGKKIYFVEREYGEFERRIPLPAKVQPEKADAGMKNGVLTIVIPKAEKEKKSSIKIRKE